MKLLFREIFIILSKFSYTGREQVHDKVKANIWQNYFLWKYILLKFIIKLCSAIF